jgi:hypothetical protein
LSWLNRTAEAAEKEKRKVLHQPAERSIQSQPAEKKKKKVKRKTKAEKRAIAETEE